MKTETPSVRPLLRLDPTQCIGCGICADVCPERALQLPRQALLPVFFADRCVLCCECQRECPTEALRLEAGEPRCPG